MRQQVSSLLACGPARPIDPLDHHPLEPRKKYCSTKNTGKPQLAAIVHYNSLPSGRVNSDSEDKTKHDQHLTKSSQVATKAAKEVGDSRVEQRNGSAPSASASASASTTATACEPMSKTKKIKFGRLFFNRNKSNKHPDGLIDNLASSNEDESKLVEDIEMMESSPDLAHESSASGQLTSKHKQQQQQQQQQPVIEFKFDLIVEGDDESSLMSQQQPEGGAPTTDPVASILRPIRQRKLLDSVNELVESFVLDSMDVCLVSAGTRRLELFDKSKKTPRTSDQFDYLLQSAELSLNYAFQLLEATHTKSAEHQHQVANCSPLRADSHSIELEAVLFVEKCSSPIEALDLLSAAKSTKETSNSDLATGQMTSQDCGSIEEALRVIDSVRARASLELAHCHNYTSEHKQSLVLMLNLKLKQQVNGGSFTNRMCMLDVSEPGGSRLKSILESIFSGQALAYLKRQKLHLKALEVSQLQQQQQQQQQVTTTTNMKHHHQIASLTRLIRAEWLIYKQLSSALIKSLVICHCHRLAPESAQDSTQQEEHVDRHLRHNVESRLMDYNLHLLGFARRLQRASWSRLKRRKRHLRRSHLAASNLSLVSDTNLSLGGESTSTQEDTSHMAQYHHDLMISSPFRQRTFLLPDALSRHPRTTQALDARLLDCYSSSHRNNHMRHHHHHHHHHTRHNYNNHRQHPETKLGLRQVCQPLRPSGGAAASLHRRSSDRHLVVSDDLEAAESSSHASSSPSTSSAVNGRNLLLERCIIGQHVGEDLDDSIASGSLISSNSNSRLGGTRRAGRHLVNSRPERTIQQQLLHLEGCPSDSNTIDDSIEMQSLTSSITLQQQQQYQSTHSDHLEMLQHENSNNEDICSTVAEPPKQLKLEEFLNKLSTFIGPANGNLEETIRPDESTLRDTTNMEEEDEDCKSHSSILEHLSSLTLESNRKMVRQHQQQQLSAGCERVSIVTDERNQVSPLDGHLQHLLKSTLRFQQERQQAKLQQPNLAEQLRALTIDCCDGALPSQQRQNGPPSGPLGANSHETPPTSTESSSCCSSTSSASCSSSSAPPGKGKCQTNRTLDQLYASVMRRQKQAEETHAIQSP